MSSGNLSLVAITHETPNRSLWFWISVPWLLLKLKQTINSKNTPGQLLSFGDKCNAKLYYHNTATVCDWLRAYTYTIIYRSSQIRESLCTSHKQHKPPNIFGILQPERLKFGVCHQMAKICSHTKFLSSWTSIVAEIWPNMWKKITQKEREGKSPQNDQKIKENWPLLRNYWSK